MPHVSGVTYPREEINTPADAVVFLMDTICFIFHLVNTGNEKRDMAFVLMLTLVSALVIGWLPLLSGQFQWSGHSNWSAGEQKRPMLGPEHLVAQTQSTCTKPYIYMRFRGSEVQLWTYSQFSILTPKSCLKMTKRNAATGSTLICFHHGFSCSLDNILTPSRMT